MRYRSVASHMPPTGDLARNPDMCPNWELNRRPFSLQAGAKPTEPHQPGLFSNLLNATGCLAWAGGWRFSSDCSSLPSACFLQHVAHAPLFLRPPCCPAPHDLTCSHVFPHSVLFYLFSQSIHHYLPTHYMSYLFILFIVYCLSLPTR